MATTLEEAASKGTANTALGLGIAGTALALGGGALGLFGGKSQNNQELASLQEKEQSDAVEATKAMYEERIKTMQEMASIRQTDMDEKFKLYQNDGSNYRELEAQIRDLKSELDKINAIRPYEQQLINNAISLEAERRSCADNKIVNYVNSTFIPQYIADMTPASTSKQETTYNPLKSDNS